MSKSCTTCANFIGPSDTAKQVKTFGVSIVGPSCGAFAIPLESTNATNPHVALVDSIGERCGSHTEKAGAIASFPEYDRRRFASAEPISGDAETPPKVRPGSCNGCVFFMDANEMEKRYGIPMAGCASKGTFIPPGMGRSIAAACTRGQEGSFIGIPPTADRLIKFYGKNITVLTPGERLPVAPAVPEPTTVSTEHEVTAEDRACGIRAWRKLSPPGPGEAVFMPVFDPAFFDDTERAKIPQTGDDEHPELYKDHQGLLYKVVVLWRHLNETPALNGFPGVGKTELFRYAAYSMQLPFERISITNSTELDELQGRVVFENQQTSFQYGRVPKAWAKPCVIVIDEPNVGPPDVWQFLRPLTDDSKQLVLDANKGERIARDPHCFMGMAFNPTWDMRNVGTHEISDADGSRLMHISVQAPDEDMEREIVADRCELDGYTVPPAIMDSIMGIAKDLRELANNDGFPMHWGVRQQIKVARATRWFPLAEAYRLAAGDLLDPEASDQLLVTVKSHTPMKNIGHMVSMDGKPVRATVHASPYAPGGIVTNSSRVDPRDMYQGSGQGTPGGWFGPPVPGAPARHAP